MKEIVIQKFGGTSVSSAEKLRKVASHIAETAKSKNVVAVVSAMGKETDRLIELAKDVSGGEPPAPELDKLLFTGEVQSASLLAIALRALGKESVSLTGFQIRLETDSTYGKAKIRGIRNIERIKELLSQDKIVVVAGFQGVIEGTDEIVTLGRGGSDLTAIALAGALGTNYCEIYTDVDGVYAIDPRLIPEAKRFGNITYSQMIQLSGAGAGVLMDRCILLAQNLGVEIKVLLSPSFGESTGGTMVQSGATLKDMEGLIWNQTGVAIQKGALVKVSDISDQSEMSEEIFKLLSGIDIIDSIEWSDEEKTQILLLCLPEDLSTVLEKLKELEEIKIGKSFEVGVLTLVNFLMKEEAGYLYRTRKAIAQAGVKKEILSSSGTSILMAVKWEDTEKLAKSLSKEFDLLKE